MEGDNAFDSITSVLVEFHLDGLDYGLSEVTMGNLIILHGSDYLFEVGDWVRCD